MMNEFKHVSWIELLKLGRQWKVIVFYMYFVKKKVRIFVWKQHLKTSHVKCAMITSKHMI
jgi:hypothetical protein